MEINEIIQAVIKELEGALDNNNPFNSFHEGYAVIKEEFEELWDEIKLNNKVRDVDKIKLEAIQLSAMSIRFLLDLC